MSLSPTRTSCWPELVEFASDIFTSDRHCVIPDHVLVHTDSDNVWPRRVIAFPPTRVAYVREGTSPPLYSLFPE